MNAEIVTMLKLGFHLDELLVNKSPVGIHNCKSRISVVLQIVPKAFLQ